MQLTVCPPHALHRQQSFHPAAGASEDDLRLSENGEGISRGVVIVCFLFGRGCGPAVRRSPPLRTFALWQLIQKVLHDGNLDGAGVEGKVDGELECGVPSMIQWALEEGHHSDAFGCQVSPVRVQHVCLKTSSATVPFARAISRDSETLILVATSLPSPGASPLF